MCSPADSVQLFFPGAVFANIDQQAFTASLTNAIMQVTGTVSYGSIVISLSSSVSPAGSVVATVGVPYDNLQVAIGNAVLTSQLVVTVGSSSYIATFTLNYGICPDGSVSPNGYAPNCQTCPANTYVCCIHSFIVDLDLQFL